MNVHVSLLAHAMAAISSLLLQRWVPVHVHYEHMIAPYQVQANTSGLQRKQHHLKGGVEEEIGWRGWGGDRVERVGGGDRLERVGRLR